MRSKESDDTEEYIRIMVNLENMHMQPDMPEIEKAFRSSSVGTKDLLSHLNIPDEYTHQLITAESDGFGGGTIRHGKSPKLPESNL